MKLRYYQQEALDGLNHWFATQSRDAYPLLVLPTGSGKTIVFVSLIKEILEIAPENRILILAHRQELIAQAKDKLLMVWPDAPCSIMAAGLKEFDASASIVIASRDTLASKKRLEAAPPFDFIVVDEAHHVSLQTETQYRKILDHFRELGDPWIMGCTATPYRMGQGYIYGLQDQFFRGVAYQAGIPELIKHGHLSRLSAFAVNKQAVIDASKVRLKFKGGDYREGELAELAMHEQTILAIIADWIDKAYTKGRLSTVFFCVTIAHAEKMTHFLREAKISAALITAETPNDERAQILKDFENGKINALCNVAVLTEGWDAPRTDCIAILRPTKSLGLYVQICGRGMRPWGEKENCLLLDYGENMERHGCIDVAKPPTPEDEEKEKIWICDACLHVNPIDAPLCGECKAPKPLPEIVESDVIPFEEAEEDAAAARIAAKGNVLSDELKEAPIQEKVHDIKNVTAEVKVSKKGNTYCGISFFTEDSFYPYSMALMIGMYGRVGVRSMAQWRNLTQWPHDLPLDVDEAVRQINLGAFSKISSITVRKEGKYWNVVGTGF